MIRVLAILETEVVIISSESSMCRFEQVHRETPLRGYYDNSFNYSFVRRMMHRAGDSLKHHEARNFPFDGLLGITIEPNGEVSSHVLTAFEFEDETATEQLVEFQGLLMNLSNSWYATTNYIVHALSNMYDQYRKIDPDLIFDICRVSQSTSEELTISRIDKTALLTSLDMISKGFPLSEVQKLWKTETHIRKNEIKELELADIQEFNTNNLSLLTSFHTVPVMG